MVPAAALAICLSACSSGGAQPSASTTMGSSTSSSVASVSPARLPPTVTQFFEKLSTGDVEEIRSAIELCEPRSPAAIFAAHQQGMASAAAAEPYQGASRYSVSVSSTATSVSWSANYTGNQDSNIDQEFGGFLLTDGKLNSWVVNGATQLGSVIKSLRVSASGSGLRLRLLTAYQADTELQITYKATTAGGRGNVSVDGYRRPAGGSKVRVDAVPYTLDLTKQSAVFGRSIAPSSGLGGTLVGQIDYEQALSLPVR